VASIFLEQLEVTQFRNLLPFHLAFSTRLNLFHGDNAQGKTNLLEAIHLLTALRPFRAGRNRELIAWDATEGSVRGTLRTAIGERQVEVRISERSRRVRVDGKALSQVEEFANTVKVILFSPEDLSLIRGAPAGRRGFLDRAIYHLYPRYAEILKDYNQVVAQKNRLLVQGDPSGALLEVWNERQAELGSHVMMTRGRFVTRIRALFEESFQEISGTSIIAGLSYAPANLELLELEGSELRRQFLASIRASSEEERRRKMTVVGPHRDDLSVSLDGRDAATYGSQGQARMLSLCLKIIELRVLLEDRGVVPIFLLDDVSSELDEHRNRYLMDYLARVGCQIFLTTTSLSHVRAEAFPEQASFNVSAGQVLADPLGKPIV